MNNTKTVVLYDLEFTAWEGSMARNWSAPWEHREVIQIAAIRITVHSGSNDATSALNENPDLFECYVKPQHNPILSSYITDLTGITQQCIEQNGTSFGQALTDFLSFCKQAQTVCSNGHDHHILMENCRLLNLPLPETIHTFRDIGLEIGATLGREGKRVTTSDLPHLLGFPPPGHAHDALADVKSLATLLYMKPDLRSRIIAPHH